MPPKPVSELLRVQLWFAHGKKWNAGARDTIRTPAPGPRAMKGARENLQSAKIGRRKAALTRIAPRNPTFGALDAGGGVVLVLDGRDASQVRKLGFFRAQ